VNASPRPFRSARTLGSAVVVLLAFQLAVLATIVVLRVLEIGLLARLARGELVSPAEADRSDDRIAAASITWAVLLVVTGIVWLVWQHRSHANLRAASLSGLRTTPGWAVGWWLIPFANLVKPFQTVRELWKASGGQPEWWRLPTWPVIGWWWASWIATAVLGRVAATLFRDARTVDALGAASRWSLATTAGTIVAAILAIAIVRSVVRRQEALPEVAARPAQLPPRPDVPERSGDPLP
jgi:Domain of unknown function (DUF4328)